MHRGSRPAFFNDLGDFEDPRFILLREERIFILEMAIGFDKIILRCFEFRMNGIYTIKT